MTGNSTTTLAMGTFDNVSVTGGGGSPTATPTNTPVPTNTPSPTPTSPGATATPTATGSPTPTPSPTPPPGGGATIQRITFMFAGQAIAVKVEGDPTSSNNGIFYFHNDHLGSTSALTKDSDGYVLSTSMVRYLPFGGYRDTGTQDLTDRGYTGHKENLDVGLIYMNARFYVPGIARFASADTIVPDPANPQSYNRYSYVNNRPLVMHDPSGHNGCTFGYLDCDADDGIDANGFPPTNSDEVNQALGAAGAASGTTALAVACELCDWYMTVNAWSQGDFSWWDLAGFLPVIPGAAGRVVDDVIDASKFADDVIDASKYADDVGDTVRAFCSFSEDTLVTTADGVKPISEVSSDELVLAYNEETGEIGFYPVIAVWEHIDPVIVTLTIDGELIETTPEHPFYTIEGSWIAAADLQVGDEIQTADWNTGTVEAIDFTIDPQPMYNFTVATAHTYFVGDGQWLVHNDCVSIGGRSVQEVVGDTHVLPGIQNSVDNSYVERYAHAMKNGTFDWNDMRDPIQLARNPDGTLVLMEGHHRFIAAQMTDTPIPWNNPNAVTVYDFPVDWPSSSWVDYSWTGR